MGDNSRAKPWSQHSPVNRSSPSSNSKQGQLEKLREYEMKRRLAYASKYDSMALYWKSHRDLLSASLQETGRAQRLVLGSSRAHQLYSNAMTAMHQDVFLDEKGNVTNEKQQKRLATSRKKNLRRIPSNRTEDTSEQEDISLLKEVRESHLTMAKLFGENARNMDEEISQEIGELLVSLKENFGKIESLGSSILEELEKTEEEVTKAWGTYLL